MPTDEYDPSGPIWPTNDGINILGTPYGSPEIVEEYFAEEASEARAAARFHLSCSQDKILKETHKMLIGSAVPRLTHIVKYVPKDDASIGWMKAVDEALLSTWLGCTGVSTLGADMSSQERDLLSTSLDLAPQLGGIGMQSLIRDVDEELLGSRASMAANLIVFLRSKSLSVYDKLAGALDAMAGDDVDDTEMSVILAVASIMAVSARAHTLLSGGHHPKRNGLCDFSDSRRKAS
jgi:hypothetical protein